MQRNRGLVSSAVSKWSGVLPTTRPDISQVFVEYVVIAGGGAGGGSYAGGGGAGGYRSNVVGELSGTSITSEQAFFTKTLTNHSVSIGAGGGISATLGNPTTFSNITCLGGGKGSIGNHQSLAPGSIASYGGSGGAASGFNAPSTNGLTSFGQPGISGQGTKGGDGSGGKQGGGGGGAASPGGNAANGVGGAGGAGIPSTITGTQVFRGGGGGGGAGNFGSEGTAGLGGVGGGGNGNNNGTGFSGVQNTGGGGGGGDQTREGGTGGSGIVILRYPIGYSITIGAGLTGSTQILNNKKVTTITAGAGNISWS